MKPLEFKEIKASSKLIDLIKQARNAQSELIEATCNTSSYDPKELVRLRGQFQSDMLAISQATRTEIAFESEAFSCEVFNRRHHELQNNLSAHQVDWMPHRISKDWHGYQQATNKLKLTQEEYFTWALEYIGG